MRDNNQVAYDLSNGMVKDFSPQHRKRFIISDLVKMKELCREGKDMYEALTYPNLLGRQKTAHLEGE